MPCQADGRASRVDLFEGEVMPVDLGSIGAADEDIYFSEVPLSVNRELPGSVF